VRAPGTSVCGMQMSRLCGRMDKCSHCGLVSAIAVVGAATICGRCFDETLAAFDLPPAEKARRWIRLGREFDGQISASDDLPEED
jgi:hypothetical protein